jgi:F0F1-type ATP synthase alpha subunit
MEAMKQGPHQPLPVVKQVVFIYAGVTGRLDALTPRQVRAFETQLHQASTRPIRISSSSSMPCGR